MSKKLRSAIAMILTLVIVIGLVPLIPVSAAADTSAVGAVMDSYRSNSSTFTLSASSRLCVPGDSAPTGALLQTLQLVQRQFAADGIPTANTMDIVWNDVSVAKAGDILVYLDASSGIAPEGYRITVTDRATVTASDVDGLLYGLNMLQKHFRTAGGNSIRGFTAADAPDTAERTVHLDIARKYLTKDWICNYIREMSWMGYNTIELHLSEDGGFRADIWDEVYFTSPNGNDFSWMVGSEEQYWCYNCEDPDQGKYLTADELVEILQTAVEYHMDVIPSFDTPAHVNWICINYYRNYRYSTFKYEGTTYTLPEYINYRGTASDSCFACLNLGDATVRKFAYAVYADIAAFFKQYAGSNEFNICGDEVALKSTDSWDYADFITYVNELNGQLKEQGYTVRMYNDFIERADYTSAAGSAVPKLDADIEVVYWDAPNSSSSYIRPAKYLVDDGRVVYSGVQNWTYYVLRQLNASSAASSSYYMMDARDPNNYWWSFHQNGEDTIYTGWDPTRLSEYNQTLYRYSGSQLGGGYFMVWCDYAGMSTEAEMWNGVWDSTGSRSDGKHFYSLRNRMWSNIIKMWNWDIDSTLSFSSFETLRDGFGDFPGLVSCSEPAFLPTTTAPERVEHVWVDGICDECGSVCDHDYTVKETPATCVEFGRTDYSCGRCGYSYTEVIESYGHNYVGGVCGTCGAVDPDYIPPVVIPKLSLAYYGLNLEPEVMYNIYYSVSDMTDVVEMGLITFSERLTDGTMEDALEVIPGSVYNGQYYMVHTNGIPAKNLGDMVFFRVYAELSDGSYAYTQTVGYNATIYADDILSKPTSDPNLKSTLVALMNYGAAAQEYFGYKTDSLMNSFLLPGEQALVEDYRADMVPGLGSLDSSKVGSFARTEDGFGKKYPKVSLGGAFSINYYFTPSAPIDGELKLYYWSTGDYEAAEVLTADNATGVVTMNPIDNSTEYYGVVEGIAAKRVGETIYVAGVYESNGVSYCTGVIPYSLAAYCLDRINQGSDKIKPVASAIAVYGYYAKNYFANL